MDGWELGFTKCMEFEKCSVCLTDGMYWYLVYLFRGDKAFCSPECRSKQITLDERSRNCSSAALKTGGGAPSRRSRVSAASSAAAA